MKKCSCGRLNISVYMGLETSCYLLLKYEFYDAAMIASGCTVLVNTGMLLAREFKLTCC